jgi:hypothetical protein
MSRYRLGSRIALVPILSALLAATGCGGGEKKAERPSGGGGMGGGAKQTESGGGRTASGEKTAIESKGSATLKGKVTFVGATVPPPRDLKPEMEKQGDKNRCLQGMTVSEDWVVGPDKGVQNVVVFLKAPPGKYFKIPDNMRHRTDTVKMDQPYCAFQPHVVAINPSCWDPASKKQVKTGQVFKIVNDAPMNHNTGWKGNDLLNPGKNTILPAKTGELVVEAQPCRATEVGKEDLVRVYCDIHKWMNARVVVLDHPYYAVTDKDGNYEIKDAPADATVDVMFWHESMDTLNKAHKETMTLKPGDNTKDFKVGG